MQGNDDAGSTQLCAIMSRRCAERALADPRLAGRPLSQVTHGSLAAILTAADRSGGLAGLLPRGRAALTRALLDHQRLLETLIEAGTVLPARIGTGLAPGEALRTLAANADLLEHALAGQADRVEYQILILWDPVQALRRRIATDPGLLRAPGEPLLSHGRRAAETVEALRAQFAEAFGRQIAAASLDLIDLPRDGDTMLANFSVLVARADLGVLETGLEAIDAASADPLRIRLVGPMPPVSFAALAIDRPCRHSLAAARRSLGLDPADARSDPAEAFRRVVMDGARGAAGTESRDMDALRAARELLRRDRAARNGLVRAALPSGAGPLPLIRICRDLAAAQPPTGRAQRRTAA